MAREGLQYSSIFTATSSGGALAFTDPQSTGTLAFKATRITFVNNGSTSSLGVHVNFTTTSGATTGDFRVDPTSTGTVVNTDRAITVEFPRSGSPGLSYTMASAGSCPCEVIAIRG